MNPRAVDLIQGLLIALATVLFGVALILGDITLPQSVVGGGFLVVAGFCWAIAAVLRRRHTRIPS
jgi:drug/metabolite transporter (DMT)-like permease